MSELTITVRFQNPGEATAAQTAQQEARDAAEQARDIARAERDAAQALRDAAQARRDAEQAGDKSGDAVVTIQLPDGKSITLNDPSPEAIATALGMPLPIPEPPEENDAPYVIGAIAIISTAVVVLSALKMWYRVYMQKGTGPAQLPGDFSQRMTRMENAIESVAVEVERISEGQRFTARLLSERAPQEVPRG